MISICRIVSRKINNPRYTHALFYVGTSVPRAFLYASSWGWVLHTTDGLKRGSYETLARAKQAAIELGVM